jgi:replicative DNA helicase
MFQERHIPYSDLRRDEIHDWSYERLADAAQVFKAMPLTIEDGGGRSVGQMRAMAANQMAKARSAGKPIRLIVIDHFHLIKAGTRRPTTREELVDSSAGIKEAAKILDAHLLVPAQLSRLQDKEKVRRPILEDLKETGSLEADADNVWLVHREAYYLERRRKEGDDSDVSRLAEIAEKKHNFDVIFAKQRMGPTGETTLWGDMATNVITDKA